MMENDAMFFAGLRTANTRFQTLHAIATEADMTRYLRSGTADVAVKRHTFVVPERIRNIDSAHHVCDILEIQYYAMVC